MEEDRGIFRKIRPTQLLERFRGYFRKEPEIPKEVELILFDIWDTLDNWVNKDSPFGISEAVFARLPENITLPLRFNQSQEIISTSIRRGDELCFKHRNRYSLWFRYKL